MEINELEKRITKFEEQKEIEREQRLHKRVKRPTGGCRMNGNRIAEIDDQSVAYGEDGAPFINDPKSPYDKMLVSTYRQTIVQPYQRKKRDQSLAAAKSYRSL